MMMANNSAIDENRCK